MDKLVLRKIIYFVFTLFLVLLITLPFLAPVLAHYGYKRISNFIYEVYSFMCHQKAHRSLFIFDQQCAWCVRDTFIWTTMLIAWIFVFKGREIRPLSWKIALLLALPMALDGGIQLIATVASLYSGHTPFYESTNTLRAFTGTLFGIAVSLFLFPRMKRELETL